MLAVEPLAVVGVVPGVVLVAIASTVVTKEVERVASRPSSEASVTQQVAVVVRLATELLDGCSVMLGELLSEDLLVRHLRTEHRTDFRVAVVV